MKEILDQLRRDARLSTADLAELVSQPEEAVARQIADWEKDGTIRGYHAMIDPELNGGTGVTAFIEVKLTPERGGGFDRRARRIAKFDQVSGCFLISGGYDLLVMVEGENLFTVAAFVSEKLSTIEGVLSTATHFRLKTYKESGFQFGESEEPERLPVTP